MVPVQRVLLLFGLLFAAIGLAAAAPATVCTITVNSADEWQAMRDRLPAERYRFVELVAPGRDDWLAASCERAIACDVLVVSGHFNAGDTFYSDRAGVSEHLRIDELERASCSGACPALFSRLKEVYLFGCESLNPDATRYASADGESGQARMRRVFAGVPAIYGFAGAAPVGPVAAMLIDRSLSGGASAFGSGRPSARLLAAFSGNALAVTRGVEASGAEGAARRYVCNFHDDRLAAAGRVDFVHRSLRDDFPRAIGSLERIERLLAAIPEDARADPAYLQALAQLSADEAIRDRFLAAERATADASRRSRMIVLARDLGWLAPDEHRAELVRLVDDLLARHEPGFAEVELACSLADARDLHGSLALPKPSASRVADAARRAIRACVGDFEARARVLAMLSSPDERVVQVAQAWLRHRPALPPEEMRVLARHILDMPPSPARIRALGALGRLAITDRETLHALAHSFAGAGSRESRSAIAEVFIRNAPRAADRPELLAALRDSRLRSPDPDGVIDALIRRLVAQADASHAPL